MAKLEWRKQCRCKGTSTSGKYGYEAERDDTGAVCRLIVTQRDYPVCDVCDRPWRRVRDEVATD